jgi:hypothetical protein
MTRDHALETFIRATANGENVRQYVKDFLAGKGDHLTGLRLDRYISTLRARAFCECKCPGFDVSNLKVCPTCKKLRRKDVTK